MGSCESHDKQEEFRLDNIVAEIQAMTALELAPIPQANRSSYKSCFEFAVLSYNIKSDWLTSPMRVFAKYDNYKDTHRCKRVIEKLKIYCPDIIFLQECTDINYFRAQLESIGYDTFIALRKNKIQIEGLIIAARRTIFKIYETKIIDFDRSDRARSNSSFLTSNLCLVAKFTHVGSGKIVNVINAQFYPDRDYEFIQYHQMGELMKFFADEFSEKDIVVWGGDIQATPYGNILEYIQNKTPPRHIDKSCHNEMKKIYDEIKSLGTDLAWGNSYSQYGKAMNRGMEYPKFTYTNGVDELVIDHLFYSANSVAPESLLVLDEDDKELPNINNPSNHLPIMVNFEILDRERT